MDKSDKINMMLGIMRLLLLLLMIMIMMKVMVMVMKMMVCTHVHTEGQQDWLLGVAPRRLLGGLA